MRSLIEQQLRERYALGAVPPSSYFPDDVYAPIHQLPLFPNRAERAIRATGDPLISLSPATAKSLAEDRTATLIRDYCEAVIQKFDIIETAVLKNSDWDEPRPKKSYGNEQPASGPKYHRLAKLFVPLRFTVTESAWSSSAGSPHAGPNVNQSLGGQSEANTGVLGRDQPGRKPREESWVGTPSRDASTSNAALTGGREGARGRDAGTTSRNPNDAGRFQIGRLLQEKRRLLVLGDPASGKSTFINWVAVVYALRRIHDPSWTQLEGADLLPEEDIVPVVLRCRELNPEKPPNSTVPAKAPWGSTLNDLLHYYLKQEMFGERAEDLARTLEDQLRKGSAVLLLDGLDEITDAVQRGSLIDLLEKIAIPNKAYIIVTSRSIGFRETNRSLEQQFTQVTVTKFLPEDKEEYTYKRFSLTESGTEARRLSQQLIQEINDTGRLERLSDNPLQLATMTVVKTTHRALPKHVHRLYEETFKIILEKTQGMLDWDETIPQLAYVAYDMNARRVQKITKLELIELLNRMRIDYPNLQQIKRIDPEEFLNLVETKTELLRTTGHGVYEFLHLVYQEYLAALAVVDRKAPMAQLPSADLSLADHVAHLAGRTSGDGQDYSAVDWWEPLQMVVAMSKDHEIEPVLLAVLQGHKKQPEVGRIRAALAAECLANEPNVSGELVDRILGQFVRYVTDDDGTGAERTTHDKAAIALARSRYAKILVRSLIKDFIQHGDRPSRGAGGLAGLMATSMAPEAGPARDMWLMGQEYWLHSPDDDEAAAGAAITITGLAFRSRFDRFPLPPERIKPIVEALLSRLNGAPPTSAAAALALFWISGGTRAEFTVHWRPDDDQLEKLWRVTADPATSLDTLANLAAIFGRQRIIKAIPVLLPWLNAASPWLRFHAVQALGQMHDVHPDLARVLAEEPEPDIRLAAVAPIGRVQSDRNMATLVAALRRAGESSDVRLACVSALGNQRGGPEVSEVLIAALDDTGDERVRIAAATVLGRTRDSSAVAALRDRLNWAATGTEEQRAIVRALDAIDDPDGLAAISAQIASLDPELRKAAMNALARTRPLPRYAVSRLAARIDDERDAGVLRSIAAALGSTGSPEAAIPLSSLVTDVYDWSVRRSAAAALARIGGPIAQKALVEYALEDEIPEIRHIAALSLGQLATKDHPDELAERLGARLIKEEPLVRHALISALGEIKGERAVDALARELEQAPFRIAAIRALGQIGNGRAIDLLNKTIESTDAEPEVAPGGAGDVDQCKGKRSCRATDRSPDQTRRSAASDGEGNRV